jgi:hypothetical protein
VKENSKSEVIILTEEKKELTFKERLALSRVMKELEEKGEKYDYKSLEANIKEIMQESEKVEKEKQKGIKVLVPIIEAPSEREVKEGVFEKEEEPIIEEYKDTDFDVEGDDTVGLPSEKKRYRTYYRRRTRFEQLEKDYGQSFIDLIDNLLSGSREFKRVRRVKGQSQVVVIKHRTFSIHQIMRLLHSLYKEEVSEGVLKKRRKYLKIRGLP